MGIFLEGEDSRGDHGLGSLVEFRFKAPPGTTSSSVTTHTVLVLQTATRALLKTQPHQIYNTQRTENKTTDVVIQQHSRKLLMMDILMSETC